ncbi:MAG: hypothetical protein KDA24_02135, partial [Deltaproteobacteria bacterium]|nr:hypothetical protein [Deltaproteobacteria bacterium]
AAAVRRGERAHAGAPALAAQAAEVQLVQGDVEGAVAALAALPDGVDPATKLRLAGEIQLVSGDRDAVAATAGQLTEAHPASPWGPLLLAALGGPGRTDALGKASSLAASELRWVDARAASAWAGAATESVSPWPRSPAETD